MTVSPRLSATWPIFRMACAMSASSFPSLRSQTPAVEQHHPLVQAPDPAYQLYSVALRAFLTEDVRVLVVAESVLAGPDQRTLAAWISARNTTTIPPVLDSLFERLKHAAPPAVLLTSRFNLPVPVRLVPPPKLIALRPGEYGVVAFSPVVFSADSSHALLYMQVVCGLRCGEGELVLFARGRDGTWAVSYRRRLWLS